MRTVILLLIAVNCYAHDFRFGLNPYTGTPGALTQNYTLTVSDPGNNDYIQSTDGFIDCGNGASDCTHSYTTGSTPELTATPATGRQFNNWTGDPTNTSTTTNPDTITINAVKSLGASFSTIVSIQLYETFETNPGYDNTWSTVSGTPDPNTDTTGLNMTGSYCLSLLSSEVSTSDFTIPSDSESWVKFQIKLSDGHPVNDIYFMRHRVGADLLGMTARVRYDGRIRIEPTGGTAGYMVNGEGEIRLIDGLTQTFYLKVRHKPETGGLDNSEYEVWYSSDGVTWGESGFFTNDAIQAGTFTKIGFLANDQSTVYIDEVEIDDSDL